MADLKISVMTAATTPLSGSEIVPIVQSGSNARVTVADLTAGRSISVADLTASTGNIIIGTTGKGIDFSATSQAGGMASEIFSDYEEGLFTPTIVGSTSAGTATYVRQAGYYTKIGNRINFSIDVVWNSGTGTGDLGIDGLPFASSSASLLKSFDVVGDGITLDALSYLQGALLSISATTLYLYQSITGAVTLTPVGYDTGGQLVVSGQYFV